MARKIGQAVAPLETGHLNSEQVKVCYCPGPQPQPYLLFAEEKLRKHFEGFREPFGSICRPNTETVDIYSEQK